MYRRPLSNANVFNPAADPSFKYDVNDFFTTARRCQHKITVTPYTMYCVNTPDSGYHFCNDHRCGLPSCTRHKVPGLDCCCQQHDSELNKSGKCKIVGCDSQRTPGYPCCSVQHSCMYVAEKKKKSSDDSLVYRCQGNHCPQLIVYTLGGPNYPGCCSHCSIHANKLGKYTFN